MAVDYNEGFAQHNGIMVITYALGLIAPFYKALGDKFGRKLLFIISTLGMTLGLFILCVCTNYLWFMIGTCISTFFLGNDIQILYILEEAPSEKRATVYSIVKALGGLSSLSIPLIRHFFLNESGSNWRVVYIIPAIAGVLVALLVLIFAKNILTINLNESFQKEM